MSCSVNIVNVAAQPILPSAKSLPWPMFAACALWDMLHTQVKVHHAQGPGMMQDAEELAAKRRKLLGRDGKVAQGSSASTGSSQSRHQPRGRSGLCCKPGSCLHGHGAKECRVAARNQECKHIEAYQGK